MKSIVKTTGLSHRYATSWAIRDINIDIQKKGIFGLLGSNGAGKSTTMNIICGVLKQTSGDVFINGLSLKTHRLEAKKNIGFLPQLAPLYLDLTVKEYLIYSANLRSMDKKNISSAIDEVMSKCNIANVQNRLLKNLSGGYRQRVGMAQAFVHKPSLVILDEPTNGLDPLQIGEVRRLIKEIAEDCTVILSSHILSEVQTLCDEIIMIEQGQLVFADSIEAFSNYVAPKSLLLSFENPPSADYLSCVEGVNRVEKVTGKSFRVFFGGNSSVNEAIISSSIEKGWRLTELTIEKNSVDEIFRQLTKRIENSN